MDYLPENDEDGKKVSICVCVYIYTHALVWVYVASWRMHRTLNIRHKTAVKDCRKAGF